MHHVDLTNMGKYHVCYVIESRDVAPCGGMCPNSFIKKLNFPLTIVKICKILCIMKHCKLPQKVGSIEWVPSMFLSLKDQINTP